jgi:hypothetical protein
MFYCAGLKRRVSAEECEDNVAAGTKGCADDCPLRKEYGLYTATAGSSEAKKQTKAELEAAPLRKCNVCQNEKPLTPEFFKKRKHFALTCIECEGEPWNKKWNKKRPDCKETAESVDASDFPAVEKPEKPRHTPALPPRQAPGLTGVEKADLDLSEFTLIKNNSRGSAVPSVHFQKHSIAFNAEASRQFEQILSVCETIDVYVKNGGGSVQIAFVGHKGMTGQYRLQKDRGSGYGISVALDRKGYSVSKGPWPVREVDGVLVAEVAI